MRYAKFVAASLGLTVLFTAAIPLLNLIADPLDVFRVVKVEGFNRIKSNYISYSRLAKPSQVERGNYPKLAIGSSRVLMGMPMTGTVWNDDPTQAFNMGLNGANLRVSRELFEHAIATTEVKEVVLTVDFFMFNAWNATAAYDQPLAKLNETSKQRFIRERDTLMGLLFSPGVSKASVATLRRQREKYDKQLADGGTNPAHEIRQALRDGYEARFQQFEDRVVRSGWSMCTDNRYDFKTNKVDAFDFYRDVLRLAKEHDITLKLFISPEHVRMMEMMAYADFWDEFEQMKRELVAIKEQEVGDNPNIELWDFSGYNARTAETIPAPGEVMQWYFDSSHFTPAFGKVILDDMFSGKPAYGVKLGTDNIEQVIERVRDEQVQFRSENPELGQVLAKRTAALLAEKAKNGLNCGAR